MKQNCWDYKGCGREPGGAKVKDLGVCPAASDETCTGLNNGVNAGRICWAVAGTFCGGKVQGDFAQKQLSCLNCDFYQDVFQEEGSDFKLLRPGHTCPTSVNKATP